MDKNIPIFDIFNVLVGGDMKNINTNSTKDDIFKYPVYSNGVSDNGLFCFTDSFKVDSESITISARGTIGACFYRNNKYTPVGRLICLTVKNNLNINLKFYYYVLSREKFIHADGAIKSLTIPMLNDIKLPDLSFEKQNKIVSILEKQESVISNIEKLISKTEKMFEYFEKNLLSGILRLDYNTVSTWKKIKIKDSMSILFGKRIIKKDSSGLIPVYGGGNASFNTDSYSYENKWVIARFALSKKCVRFIDEKFWLLDSGFTFKSINNNDEDFLGFKINSMQEYIYNVLARGAAQKNVDMKEFENLEIEIPSYEEQKNISIFLRRIINLLNDQNKLLKKEKQKFEWLSEKLLSGEYLVVEEEQE